MKISVRWLNEYLDPANLTGAEAEGALTNAGFPIESAEPLADGDTRLDVEVTSNRGDCLSHVGVAREVAAMTGRRFKPPMVTPCDELGRAEDGPIRGHCTLENRVPDLCPLFTLRLIRGVKVGPSPAWMVRALEAVGQRSISNVVDVTNYVLFELGQPTHAFDLGRLAGGAGAAPSVIVRRAEKGEGLALLDGRRIVLGGDELVVADAERAVSLAGIMGGAGTEVRAGTVDVLLEAAAWDPATIRRAARRFGVRTDAGHRFERTVDPRTVDLAARRAMMLLMDVAGGALAPGSLSAGREAGPLTRVTLRPSRCVRVLGLDVPAERIARVLRSLEIGVEGDRGGKGGEGEGDALRCIVPAFRPDLTREIDLIEEVARTVGLEALPVGARMTIAVAPPQASEAAGAELARALAGAGFYETVTFSFLARKHAAPFLQRGAAALEVCDERRKAEPALRPSLIPSLLLCRRANADAGAGSDQGAGGGGGAGGGVRLFEIASTFHEETGGADADGGKAQGVRPRGVETRRVALVCDALGATGQAGLTTHEQKQMALRLLKGALGAAAVALGGPGAGFETVGAEPPHGGFAPGACGRVVVNGEGAGWLGLVSPKVQALFGLEHPVGAAEVDLAALLALHPARGVVAALPAFPSIDRDLSLIVDEPTPWAAVSATVRAAGLERLEGVRFVGVYRGAQAGRGKKSVTLRLTFRDPAKTLRREEVEPQMEALVARAREELGAAVRV